jgi:hypothetical protein
MLRLVAVAGLLAAGACADAQPDAAAATEPAAIALRAVAEGAVPELPVAGRVADGARWQDERGENLILLVETGAIPAGTPSCENCRDAGVYAFHLVATEGGWRELWRVSDRLTDCDLDLYAAFVAGSLKVTDLDEDGVPETTFQYTLACRTGVRPAVRKLVMREGDAAYEIRGTTDLRRLRAPAEAGGMMRVHPSFETAEPALRSFALREWHRLIAIDDFERF